MSKIQKCQEIFRIGDDARMTSNFLIIGIQNHVKGKSQGVKAFHLQLPIHLLKGASVRVELGKYKLFLKHFQQLLQGSPHFPLMQDWCTLPIGLSLQSIEEPTSLTPATGRE